MHCQRRRRRRVALVLFLLLLQKSDADSKEDERKKALAGRREPWFIRLSRRLVTGETRRDLLRVCYGRYGCFSVDWPWFNSYRVLNSVPKSPKAIRPKFHLYTRRQSHHEMLEGSFYTLSTSDFDPNRMTFLLTHGYLEHGKKSWLQQMKEELLKHGDHNVIIIDWLAASRPPYTQAVANLRLIGTMTAHFLRFLAASSGLDPMRVHMVGHSLGAHLSGQAGSVLKRRFGLELGRITGLDPAEPHFEWGHPVTRLDETDAFFVDVIHTDGNPVLSLGLGVIQPCGHLDFYPNGGKIMSGCDRTLMGGLSQEDGHLALGFRRMISCNHIRSYEYFIESINSDCPFLAVECDSWEEFVTGKCQGCLSENSTSNSGCEYMGFRAFASLNGSAPEFKHRHMYLMTEGRKPFCSFPYRVTVVLSDTRESLSQGGDRGNFYLVLHGDRNSSSSRHLLNDKEIFFEPGRDYNFIITSRGLGNLRFAEVTWEFSFHLLNPITWRLLTYSRIFLNRIEIAEFGSHQRHTFCAQDRPLVPGKPFKVQYMPDCRQNRPDPGSTFLGAVLNSDPVGNAEFILNQVNPLKMNPLNGLSNLGLALNSFADGVQQVSATIRRTGTEAKRRVDQTGVVEWIYSMFGGFLK